MVKIALITIFSICNSTFAQLLPDAGVNLVNKEENEILNKENENSTSLPQGLAIQKKEFVFQRNITDLQPFPNSKEFYLNTFFLFSHNSADTTSFQNISSNSNSLIFDLTGAVTSNISLGVSYAYLLSNKVEVDGIEKGNSKGAYDPTFSTTFRLMDLERNKYDINLGFSYSPNLKDSKNATETTEGNARNSSDTFSAKLSIGRRNEKQSWAYSVILVHQNKGYFLDSKTNEKTNTKSWQAVLLSADYLYKLNNEFSYKIGFGIERTGALNYIPENSNPYAVGINHDFLVNLQGYFQFYKNMYLTFGTELIYGTNEDYDSYSVNALIGTMLKF